MNKRAWFFFVLIVLGAFLFYPNIFPLKFQKNLPDSNPRQSSPDQPLVVENPIVAGSIMPEEESVVIEKKWTQELRKIQQEQAKLKQENRTAELSKFETLGYRCSIFSKETLVIKDQQLWARILGRMEIETATSLFPHINFETHMIAAVFTGEQPFTEQLLMIHSQELEKATSGKKLVILYRRIFAPKGSTISSIMVQPYHFRILPLYKGPIEFREVV